MRNIETEPTALKLMQTDVRQLFTEDSEDLKSGGDDVPSARTPQ